MFALVAFVALSTCEAGIVKMGLQKDKMPVDVNSVLHTFERARRLQFFEMRALQTNSEQEQVSLSDFIHNHDEDTHDHTEIAEARVEENTTEVVENVTEVEEFAAGVVETAQVVEEDAGKIDYEDVIIDVNKTEVAANHSLNVAEFVEIQQEIHSNATVTIQNETMSDDDESDDSVFFNVPDMEPVDTAVEEAPAADFASETVEDEVVVGRASVVTGPRGGTADLSPKLEPTEISFMIVMEDFRYSNGVQNLEDIQIGTKFGFTGRIVTQAEELGVASGSCTVTSDINKELSYCDIYHKIDTDNFGGYGSVMVAGTADDIGGRFLVTGTGGSLQTTSQGYAMVQFDPAGNPVLYVLLKLF